MPHEYDKYHPEGYHYVPEREESSHYYHEESTEASHEREDERWSTANQLRDWMYLTIFLIIHFTWMFIVFLFERGIR